MREAEGGSAVRLNALPPIPFDTTAEAEDLLMGRDHAGVKSRTTAQLGNALTNLRAGCAESCFQIPRFIGPIGRCGDAQEVGGQFEVLRAIDDEIATVTTK